jgi:hypothetical protein
MERARRRDSRGFGRLRTPPFGLKLGSFSPSELGHARVPRLLGRQGNPFDARTGINSFVGPETAISEIVICGFGNILRGAELRDRFIYCHWSSPLRADDQIKKSPALI